MHLSAMSPVFVLVTLLVVFLDPMHGGVLSKKNVIDGTVLSQKVGNNRTIIVDANGTGQFKTVQAAIDHVPDGNSKWITIHIRRGVYREKVTVPANKPYIFLRGNGKGKTSIVWSDNSAKSRDSATFKLEAPHFVAFGISFKNEASTGISQTSQNRSVAAVVAADMAAFYHCAFYSNHNTLFDFKGRHYYDRCYVQGSVDFIFGQGLAMFHDSELFVIRDGNREVKGSVTANFKGSHNDSSGFVFLNSKVYGTGHVYLGRAKGTHSKVVFASSYLSKAVIPEGWTDHKYTDSTDNLYQAEYKCHGPGSTSENRVHWSKQLTEKEAAPFLNIDFIDGKEWLPAW